MDSGTPNVPAPQPPRATRLRPTVLLAVLALAGVTALVTVLAVTRSRPPAATAAAPDGEPLASSRPAQPDFLAEPPRPGEGPTTIATLEQERLEALLARQQADLEAPPPEDFTAGDPFAAEDLSPEAATPDALASERPADPRARGLEEALRSPLRPAAFAPAPAPAAAPPPPPFAADLQALLGPALSQAAESSGGLPPAGRPAREEPAQDVPAARPASTGLPFTYDRKPHPFRLQQGTVLPAVLLTAVSSDLPGALVAQLSRDVYDSLDQRYLLLPRGSRLLGRYENQIALGQNRLLVAWDRILFPDGTSLALPGLPSGATDGSAGLPAAVDSHFGRVFGHALLLSLLSAGVQLSQPQQSATAGQAPSTGQIAAGALGQELGLVATELIRRNLDVRPTLSLPAGLEFSVYLSADLTLPSPYEPAR